MSRRACGGAGPPQDTLTRHDPTCPNHKTLGPNHENPGSKPNLRVGQYSTLNAACALFLRKLTHVADPGEELLVASPGSVLAVLEFGLSVVEDLTDRFPALRPQLDRQPKGEQQSRRQAT